MRVFVRPKTSTEPVSAAWPHGFQHFLREQGSLAKTSVLLAQTTQNEVVIPHGNLGAQLIFTRESPLPDAWRVAAFHSNLVAELSSFQPEGLAKADGIVVTGQDFRSPLAIATADCLAVAFTLESAAGVELASCFHAGWRGYFAGIQQNALHWFAGRQAAVSSQDNHWLRRLHVSIGPAIAGHNYPCGNDVRSALEEHLSNRLRALAGWSTAHESAYHSAHASPESHPDRVNKIFPDLQTLMILELTACGVPLENIAVLREDTFESSWWPSHRRAVASGLAKAGRLFTHLCPASCRQVQNHGSNR